MHVDCADVAAANEPGGPPVCAEAAAAIVSAASAMALHGQLLGARPAEARGAARTMYLSDERDPRPRVTRLPPRQVEDYYNPVPLVTIPGRFQSSVPSEPTAYRPP